MLLNVGQSKARMPFGLGLLVAFALSSGSALAAELPAPVRAAQDSVVRVETPRQRGSAFLVTSDGLFVTASATVARASDITLVYKGDRYPAERLESSAPRGVALLRSRVPTGEEPLTVASADADRGTRLFVLAVSKSGRPVARRASLQRVNPVGSLEVGRAQTVAGESGGPLVTSKGEVFGVTSPPRPGERSSALVSYRLERVPQETSGVRADAGSGFPAVPVAIGLGILLLIANIAVRALRGRALSTESPVPVSPGTGTPAGTPAGPPVDDLEISLKPR